MHVACENTVTVNFLLVFLCKPCVFLERTLTCAHDPVTCLCGALSLPEKRRCWKPLTAETQSPNNVLCLCKPHYWLQALMLICFSSSEGGWSNFGWATQNKAVRRFLRQQVHRNTQAVSAGEAGSWRWVSVLIHTIITFVYKKAKQYETSATAI